nr:HAD family phosphatase [uncultured Cohaesibacter sp.]
MIDAHTFAPFKAAIFDLDGTLIHSEHAWQKAKIDVLARNRIVPDQALLDAYVGRGMRDFLNELLGETATDAFKTDISNQVGAMADDLLPVMRRPVEGATDLLKNLAGRGLRIAICSSAPRRHIKSAMEALEITDLVELMVSGADLPRGKPHPLPYLTTLEALNLAPQEACAFEDSIPGAQSAHEAGLAVFAVGAGCTDRAFDFCTRQAESYLDLSF